MSARPSFGWTAYAVFIGFMVGGTLALGDPRALAQELDPAAQADLITDALAAIARRDWHLVGSVVLMALVFALRTYGGALVERLRIDTHLGGVLTNFLLAFAGMWATALKLKQPIDLHFVVLAVTTALAAAGGWHSLAKPLLTWWRARRKVADESERRREAVAAALAALPAGASVEEQRAAVDRALAGA
jgi:hypothetical protein